MSTRVLAGLSVLLATFTAHGAEEPQWLKDARAREGKPGPAVELKSKDHWFKARVPAIVVGVIEKVEGSYSIEFNIGGDQAAYCEVVPDGFDMANMLRRTLDITLKQVEETQGKVEMRSIESIDAGVFGEVPYLQTQWVYRVNDGKEQRLGGLKQIAMEKGGQGIYCAHVDLGYVKTFNTIVKALADSFESTTPSATPYYFEVAVASALGMKVGIVVTTLERDADGDTKAEQRTAMLIPAGAGAVHSQDAVSEQWIRPDASLINAARFISTDGELSTSLHLKSADGTWIVEGDHEGKKLAEKLQPDAQPTTWVAQAFALRKLLATANPVGAEHSMPQWLSNDPIRLIDSRTKILAKSGDRKFKALATAGNLEARVTLDQATGMVETAEMGLGPQKMLLERIYLKGSF
jgi:hypothetical protein